jgi:hypothetical protein
MKIPRRKQGYLRSIGNFVRAGFTTKLKRIKIRGMNADVPEVLILAHIIHVQTVVCIVMQIIIQGWWKKILKIIIFYHQY